MLPGDQKKKMTREEMMSVHARGGEERLLYAEFQKIVLDFQLKEHEKFLRKFMVVFKSVDTDNNGLLNEREFRELVLRMRVCDSEKDIEYFLTVVDPYNNNQITFSEIVHLFSAHMVQDAGGRSIALLEKFAKDDAYDVTPYMHN